MVNLSLRFFLLHWFMRKFYKFIFGFVLLILVLCAISITSLDTEQYQETPFYQKTIQNIEGLNLDNHVSEKSVLIGWSKQNITPSFPVDMAGYGNRGVFETVNDSIFVRTFLFQEGDKQYAIISFDLIMVSQDLKNAIVSSLKKDKKWENLQIYFSATHTHSSIGGWTKGILSKLTLGGYEQKVVDLLCSQTAKSLQKSQSFLEPVIVSYSKIETKNKVENRILGSASVDPYLRTIIFKTPTRLATLSSFSAHPTNLHVRSTELSGDYPVYFCQKLEEKVNFSMFCAGMVGSHRTTKIKKTSESIKKYGEELADRILDHFPQDYDTLKTMSYQEIPIEVRDWNYRLNPFIRLRPFVFNTLYSAGNLSITSLKLNDMLLLGTPCDFSGELYPVIERGLDKETSVMITSFNGGYVGYVNNSEHYHRDHTEISQMTWLGEDNGDYFIEIVTKIINKLN